MRQHKSVTGIGHSLKEVLMALKNVLGRLFLSHPNFALLSIGMISWLLYYLMISETRMTFVLCFLVTSFSILNYIKSKNYSETILSFMLGLLTVFTIPWTPYTSTLFLAFYIGINTIFFMVTSISVHSKVETELTAAASFVNINNFKETYKMLGKISKSNTRYNILGAIDKAKAVKFMTSIGVEVRELSDGLTNIECIKIVYQIELEKAYEIFRTLYFITKRTNSSAGVSDFLDEIVARKIPLPPSELFNIIAKTKGVIVRVNENLPVYFNILERLAKEGHEEEEIIARLNAH